MSPPRGQLFVAGLPAPKGSTRAFYVAKLRRAVVTNDNTRTRPWEQMVRAEAIAAGATIHDGAIGLKLIFFLPRPRGHLGKNGLRPAAPPFPTVKPDLDKLARAVMDALTGVLYHDDAQVVDLVPRKRYAAAPSETGVQIEWWP